MHKTFTDCYFAKGFTGGGWAYALNSNDAEGHEIDVGGTEEPLLEEKDRKLAYYIIGWDSIAVGAASYRSSVLAATDSILGTR